MCVHFYVDVFLCVCVPVCSCVCVCVCADAYCSISSCLAPRVLLFHSQCLCLCGDVQLMLAHNASNRAAYLEEYSYQTQDDQELLHCLHRESSCQGTHTHTHTRLPISPLAAYRSRLLVCAVKGGSIVTVGPVLFPNSSFVCFSISHSLTTSTTSSTLTVSPQLPLSQSHLLPLIVSPPHHLLSLTASPPPPPLS